MAGKVCVVATGRRVEPLGDPVGDALIGNRCLRDWQAEAFAEAGLAVGDSVDSSRAVS